MIDYTYKRVEAHRVVNGRTWDQWRTWWLAGVASRGVKFTNEQECRERTEKWPDWAKKAPRI